jgi:hypothetical protein
MEIAEEVLTSRQQGRKGEGNYAMEKKNVQRLILASPNGNRRACNRSMAALVRRT